MITAMLCSLALQSTPGSTTDNGGPMGPSQSSTRSSDFFLSRGQQERATAPRAQDDSFLGKGELAAEAARGQDEVTRTYDVRALGLAPWDHDGDETQRAGLRLVPALEMVNNNTNVIYGAVAPTLADESRVNLLVDLLGRTAQAEGRSVAVSSGGQLIVSGPPALHTTVESLLALIGEIAASESRLVLDVVRMDLAAALALDGVLLPRARAEELARGASERFEVALRDDAGASIDSKRARSVVLDYSVEVAQGAAIGDPLTAYCALGTQLFAKAAPALGGVELALVVKRGDLAVARRTSGVAVMARHVGEDGRAFTYPCATLLEDPTWSAASFATSCFLPADQALVLVGASEGGEAEVLLLSVTGTAAAPFRSAKFADGGVVALLHLGALVPPDLLAEGITFGDTVSNQRTVRVDGLIGGDETGLLTCSPVYGAWAAARDGLLRRLGRGAEHWEVGPWLVIRGDERALALADAVTRRPPSLQVHLRFESGERALRTARFPLRLGSGGAVALTNEAFDAVESDVEIAERSMSSDVSLEHVFDGLMCWVRALPLGADRIVLETAGAAQIMGSRRAKVMDDVLVPALEERDVEHLGLRGRQVLTKGTDGVYRAVLGTQRGDGLRVVIELR
jgi:hypothetical protein